MDSSGPSDWKEHSGVLRSCYQVRACPADLRVDFQLNNSGESQMYRRGSQCKVSERDCDLPAHTVSSPGSGEAFGSGLRKAALLFPETKAWGQDPPITPNHI